MIKTIAIDLDDTLIDTTGLLLPEAAKQACQVLIQHGYPETLEHCLLQRKHLAHKMPHRELFFKIAGPNLDQAARMAVETFYHPQLPAHLPLMEGALDVLHVLQKRYVLYLVTSGAPVAQNQKIAAAGLKKIFKDCLVVDGFKKETKKEAFSKILKHEGHPPQLLLSVGNRLSQEIFMAKTLGAQTCHFPHGEHASETPQNKDEIPDHTFHHWKEFISACHL